MAEPRNVVTMYEVPTASTGSAMPASGVNGARLTRRTPGLCCRRRTRPRRTGWYPGCSPTRSPTDRRPGRALHRSRRSGRRDRTPRSAGAPHRRCRSGPRYSPRTSKLRQSHRHGGGARRILIKQPSPQAPCRSAQLLAWRTPPAFAHAPQNTDRTTQRSARRSPIRRGRRTDLTASRCLRISYTNRRVACSQPPNTRRPNSTPR
jgi:hypothetical protein